jgi:heme exporter protein D
MTGGVITGGWGFVWAAYGLTFSILAIYTISVLVRYRAEKLRGKA